MTVNTDGAFAGILPEPSGDHFRKSNAASIGQLSQRRTPRLIFIKCPYDGFMNEHIRQSFKSESALCVTLLAVSEIPPPPYSHYNP